MCNLILSINVRVAESDQVDIRQNNVNRWENLSQMKKKRIITKRKTSKQG